MTTTEALKKSCPLHRSSLCEAGKCMAWQSTSQTEGFCQMISRTRTVFVSPQSSALQVDLQDAVAVKIGDPLEIRIEQREYDCLEVRLKE